ncbi:MAG TPA: SEC-C metal-binding domain-containing protein [Lacipirellulaceae bacterium]|nr:SEC-C metal-binding domain-containing protein [Lacipirellulaceae bacterium]
MKVGRNDPCPCGSGKKYKKCCLDKGAAPLAAPTPTSNSTEPTEDEGALDWGETESTHDVEGELPTDVAVQPERPPLRQYPRPDENLPPLASDKETIIEDWWKGVAPHYTKRDADQMIERVKLALTEFPSLFSHLALHEEFLFELGGELGRRGRIPEYIALLKRLRRDQRQMYSFSYGAYDSDVIAELVVAGQGEEIPAYFDLFKQYPDTQPDYCHQICNLLAWRGLSEPLYLLCEAVATPMVTSSEVVGGHFALDWLIRREEIPFYEAQDASTDAVQRAVAATKALGERLQFPLTPDEDWLLTALRTCSESPQVETRGTSATGPGSSWA